MDAPKKWQQQHFGKTRKTNARIFAGGTEPPGSSEIWTHDPWFTRPVLYPLSYGASEFCIIFPLQTFHIIISSVNSRVKWNLLCYIVLLQGFSIPLPNGTEANTRITKLPTHQVSPNLDFTLFQFIPANTSRAIHGSPFPSRVWEVYKQEAMIFCLFIAVALIYQWRNLSFWKRTLYIPLLSFGNQLCVSLGYSNTLILS